MAGNQRQLISYLAPAAPARRRPAAGDEPFLRPEVGFTPRWFRKNLDLDFGERFHTDPSYRRDCIVTMREELGRRFPGTRIGRIDGPDAPLDLLTGAYGICVIPAIFGVSIVYAEDNWPAAAHEYLTDEQLDQLEPPDLDRNPFFRQLLDQIDWIAEEEGRVEGYVNWQGVLNNAQRLRGQQLFTDLVDRGDRVRRLCDCVCTTMIEAARRTHARRRESGAGLPSFFSVSNCLVNMLSPQQYAEHFLPFDRRIADEFGTFGVHNCAWTADPYLEHYATLPHVGYIDMGKDSDLRRAKALFPDARRAIMVTPMDLANKTLGGIRSDLDHIAREFAPCDIVLSDIEDTTPDERVLAVVKMCEELSR